MNDPFVKLDATAQAALVQSRQVHPRELVEAAIRRIEALNPTLNAIVSPAFEQARRTAGTALPAGPFIGVPYAIKDLLDVAGLRRSAGSRLLRENVSHASADIVLRSQEAGFIVLGKTNMPEFALNASTEPLLFGPARNPWNTARSAGGSSGGAAAAVASGMLPIAHASDGGGSIRIPASCCGLFGLKPSRGRMAGSLPTDSGVEHALTRSVRDSARLFAWNQRSDAQAPLSALAWVTQPTDARLKIALSTQDLWGREPAPAVQRASLQAAKLCSELGHHVEPARLPVDGERFMQHFMTAWSGGAERMLQQAEAQGDDADAVLEPWTLHLARHARQLPPGAMDDAARHFAIVTREVAAFFERFDVVLSPVLSEPAPLLGWLGPQVPGAMMWERLLRYVGYTPVHNAAGTPAMSVPLGMSHEGLPIGVQFAARIGAEDTLLALALQLEAASPFQMPA